MCADPKSAKKTVKLSVFFALWGSALVKAAQRTLMKLTPGLKYINKWWLKKCKKDSQIVSLFCPLGICKRERMLMNLTPVERERERDY